MRTWFLSAQAAADLSGQIAYLKQQEAFGPAQRLAENVEQFLNDQLCVRPLRRRVDERNLWEVWIPGTKLVLWYRFDDTEFEVVRIWHTSQDRQGSP